MQRFGDEKPDAEFEAMLDLMGLLYGDAVLLRSFPAGLDEEQCHFSGALDDVSSNFDRTTLFGRYGLAPQEWTLVAQVAAIPENSGTRSGRITASPKWSKVTV